jgi:hypothetical protein
MVIVVKIKFIASDANLFKLVQNSNRVAFLIIIIKKKTYLIGISIGNRVALRRLYFYK